MSNQTPIKERKKIDELNTAPDPKWSTLPARNIAYGIEVETFNPTDDAPSMILSGTNGKLTTSIKLDNVPDNFKKGKKDYFVFAAEDIGNVGHPLAIEFKAGGNDGWGFRDIRVDFYADPNKTFSSSTIRDTQVFNDRARSQTILGQPVAQIRFEGAGRIDGNRSTATDDGVRMVYKDKSTIFYAEGSGSIKPLGRPIEFEIGKRFIIIDSRNFDVPVVWDTKRDTSTTVGEVKSSLQKRTSLNETENTLAIGVSTTAGASATDPTTGIGANFSTTYSMENTFRVKTQNTKASEDGVVLSGESSLSNSDATKYTILPGNLAIIRITLFGSLTEYESSAYPQLKLYDASILTSFKIEPRIYRKDDTGSLQLARMKSKKDNGEIIYQFDGPMLSEDTILAKSVGLHGI